MYKDFSENGFLIVLCPDTGFFNLLENNQDRIKMFCIGLKVSSDVVQLHVLCLFELCGTYGITTRRILPKVVFKKHSDCYHSQLILSKNCSEEFIHFNLPLLKLTNSHR